MFSFNSSSLQTEFSSQKTKNKPPSDQRRSALRLEKFLENKRNSSEPAASPSNSSLASSLDTSTASTEIEESPLIPENSDAMDTLEEETIPENTETRKNLETNVDNSSATDKHSPPTTSPTDQQEKPKNPKDEIHLLFCASDQAKAESLAKKFKGSQYLGPNPRNKKHHFFFSLKHHGFDLKTLKSDVNILNKKYDVIMFRVVAENQNFYPDQQNHCLECQHHHHLQQK